MDFNPGSGRPPAPQQQPSGQSGPPFPGPGPSEQYQGMSQGGTMQQLYVQQRQQQLMQMQQQPGAQQPAQNVPTAAAASSSSSSVQARIDPKRQMVPAPFPPEYLGDLSKYSVGALCLIGKEIVSELTIRAGALFSLLKPEKQSTQDPLLYIEYNNKLFEQLAQIRAKLSDLSCDLKFLDWTAAVSDPGHLKRVDKMHTSRDTGHH